MPNPYIELSGLQVGVAATLILINGAISLTLGLGLERKLLLAAARSTGQLLLIGFVLHWVFSVNRWYVVVAVTVAMTVTASIASVRRTKYRHPDIWWNSLVSTWASSWCITAVAVFVVVGVKPWYLPQYVIPFLGMILGNTLTGISLGLDRLGGELDSRRDQVEGLLALGATRWEAARPAVREAIRTGMIPIINVMMVAGIVSLPGMMTGQLLSGVDPIQAVKYQIVILFLIASGTALGTVGVVLLGYRRLFSHSHQFLYDRLREHS